MRRTTVSLLLLICSLVVFIPVAVASTVETWTDGLYDAENEGDILVAQSIQDEVDLASRTTIAPTHEVVAVVALADPDDVVRVAPLTRPPRAPPTP